MRQSDHNLYMSMKQSLFPVTQTFPQFFNHNLIDDNRVIKVLIGQKACLRAFYYQLFKLVFEIEIEGGDNDSNEGEFPDYVGLVNRILLSLGETEKKMQSHIQKIQNFLQKVGQNPALSFEIQIQLEKSIDQAMIAILQTYLAAENLLHGSVQEIFLYLSSIFQLTAGQYSNCFKFAESDVFVYIQKPTELYLAYLEVNEGEEPENEQKASESEANDSSSYSRQEQEEEKEVQKVGTDFSKEKRKNEKNDTIMNIFGDMLYSSKNDGNSKVYQTDSLTSINPAFLASPHRDDPKVQCFPPFNRQIKEQEHNFSQVDAYDLPEKRFQKVKTIPVEEVKVKTSQIKTQQYEKEEDMFYRPKMSIQRPNEIASSKESMLKSKYRKDPLDIDGDEEKGTFYRQFTDTRILNILPQPQRTKVKILKNRFIGVHSHKS